MTDVIDFAHPYARKHFPTDETVTVQVETEVRLVDFVSNTAMTVGHENIEAFIKGLDAVEEDWELTCNLSQYFANTVTDFLKDHDEDPEWQTEWKDFLKQQLYLMGENV